MGRKVLDKLHVASARGAIHRALSGGVDDDDFAFLRDHVDELTADDFVKLLRAGRATEDTGIEPFVVRLADIIAAEPEHRALDILDLAASVNARAWADLTRRLRGRVRDPIWFFFVDARPGYFPHP
jgi:hypothetical protein